MKHVIRPAARDDIIRLFRFRLVELNNPELADQLLKSVAASIQIVCKMPELGAPKLLRTKALAGMRSWAVENFEDIRIYYLVRGDVLRVVRVLHGKRNVKRLLRREKDLDEDNEPMQ